MNRFKKIIIKRQEGVFYNIEYLSQVMFLYMRYEKFLDDDYARNGQSFYEYFINLVERVCPLFWALVDGEKVTGFVFLDNLIGDENRIHCAELTTCFDKAYWGAYTKESAELFLEFCLGVYGLNKIKVLVYPQNHLAKGLLRHCGFEKEGHLKSETMKDSKFQDVEIYSRRKEKLCKI